MLRKLIGNACCRKKSRTAVVLSLSACVAINGSRRLEALIVFDPSNYSQNLLTAAHTLDQINNQLRGLENQAQMLINQAKNLTKLPTTAAGQLTSNINAINSLIAQAKGITFNVQQTSNAFQQVYPRQYTAAISSNQMVRDAASRWDNTYQAFRQTLVTQATIASQLQQDGQTLANLMAGSSGSVGALQALQSSNELLALQVKQSLQTQALIATQARADALRSAEQQASAAAATERFTRFIGNANAYTNGQ